MVDRWAITTYNAVETAYDNLEIISHSLDFYFETRCMSESGKPVPNQSRPQPA